ncbi:MAG: hypothetical protein RBT80_15210 [Candidatus Vecturithrix sp.]|nr:hypothetical protein [Candidatus Vecturithrix sp.]
MNKRLYLNQKAPSYRVGRFLRQSWLLLSGVMLLLSGCPGKPKLAPIYPPQPEFPVTTEIVAQLINERIRSFENLVGAGKVSINTWQEKYKFSETFVLEKPGKFRLETLGFLDQPAVFLTSNESMLTLYSKKQNICYKGVASQENLFRLSGINLAVEDAIQVLSGNPTRIISPNIEWGMPLPDQHQYYLERISLLQEVVQRIWFDAERSVIAYFEEAMLTNGEILLKVQFSDYRAEAGGYPIPATIQIDRPLDQTRVQIDYKFFDVNQPVDQELFVFVPPSDAKIHNIDDRTLEEIEQLAPYKEFRTNEE